MTRAPRRILIGSVQRELCAELVDGGVVDLADLRSKDAGATLYVPEIPWGSLERVLGSGDRILASASSPVEARLKCPGGGVLRVQEARGGWGLEDVADGWSAEELARFVGEAEDLLLEYGLSWGLSASAVAAEGIKAASQDELEGFTLRQLRPRWRTLAHEAVHGGPIACVYGGGRSPVTTIDLRAAYLQGLAQPLPVAGSWVPFGPWDRWAQVRSKEGLVRAIVDVPTPRWRGLGLLPVKLVGRTVHPVGRIVGSWTIAQLREAEELGAEVVQLVEGATCRTSPHLAPLAEKLWRLRESGGLGKLLSRAIYTRAWGIMVSRGRWEGARPDDDALRPPAPRRVREDSSLVYAHLRPLADPLTPRADPVYRPDWAAFISGWTARLMMRACDALSGQLVAVHVDSIATMTGEPQARDWVSSALRTGLWHEVQAPARGRWWGPGLALHGERQLQQGCPGAPSGLELARWASRGLGGEAQAGLTWTIKGGAKRSRWAEARSTAWRLPGEHLHTLAWGGEDVDARLSLWSPIWTPKGWTQDPPEGMLRDERLGPRAPLGPPLVEPETLEPEEEPDYIPSGYDDPGP